MSYYLLEAPNLLFNPSIADLYILGTLGPWVYIGRTLEQFKVPLMLHLISDTILLPFTTITQVICSAIPSKFGDFTENVSSSLNFTHF